MNYRKNAILVDGHSYALSLGRMQQSISLKRAMYQ